jgi:hypothetical protein
MRTKKLVSFVNGSASQKSGTGTKRKFW